jgi:RNA polymerase sigma-70 factor (ECF subfamily)
MTDGMISFPVMEVASVPESHPSAAGTSDAPADAARLTRCVRAYLPIVWRMLRRHGVAKDDADDAAQKVFLVFSRRLETTAVEQELPSLMRTAVYVASEVRRSQRRRREEFDPTLEKHVAHGPTPDVALEEREALGALDAILSQMDEALRTVFILFELEEMTMATIAVALDLPPGTVASRLRRAREQFESLCQQGAAR